MTAPQKTDGSLVITLFGPMQVLVEGHPLPHLRSRKGLWLLALLTLRQGRPVEREWLAGTLWPDTEQSLAFANLRTVLSELRGGLGSQKERIESPDRHTLRLDLNGADVDLVAFDAAIKSQILTELDQATSFYRGHLLEGCTEEWVFQERTAREQSCLQALQKLGDASLSAGNYEKAIDCYQRAISIDPWWDTAWRGRMEALAKSGDRNAALHAYREFVEVLRDDPNASPDEQTTALYVRLRAEVRTQNRSPAVVVSEPVIAPKVEGYLPHPMTNLIGREDERLEVSSRLRRSRLLTLTGLGGIGKTRLALEVAREVAREYADGVWLVALDTLTEGKQVVPQIASVLGLKEEAGCPLRETVTRHLRTKRLLLVLDNCEHLLEASAHVAQYLLQECASVRILATSREALGITGETAWAVPILAVPEPAHLPQGHATLLRVVGSYESVQLFMERAQAVQQTFVLTGSNALTVAQLCFRLEGIPLAIELAAARVKALTVEQIAARFENNSGLLTGGNRTAQSRQQTLRATLDWSYALLSEPERLLLARLSVFIGGWTLEAAEGVCADTETAESLLPLTSTKPYAAKEEIVHLLTSLVDKSLVAFEAREQRSGGRYRLVEIVRQYAREKLLQGEEAQELERRHRDWFVALSEKAEPELTGAEQKSWVEHLVTDYDNLRAVLACCAKEKEGREAGLRLTGALWRFWYIRSDYHEGRRHLHEALANDSEQLPTKARAKALHGEGVMLYRQGEYLSAKECHEKALSIREQIGDRRGVGDSLFNLGNVMHNLGDHASGRAFYEQSMDIRREIGDRHGIAMILGNLGSWAFERADLAEAQSLYEESLALFREQGDKFQVAWALDNLGIIASLHGDYATAEKYLEESLPVFAELGERRGTAWSLHKLAVIDHDHCRYDTAQTRYQESLSIFKELGDKRGTACSFHELGMLTIDQGDKEAARLWLTDGLHLFEEIGDKPGIAYSFTGLGGLAHLEGDLTRAKTSLAESLHRFHDLDEKKGMIASIEERAYVMMDEAEIEMAVRLMGAAHRLRENIGLPMPPNTQLKINPLIDHARTSLGMDVFTNAWEEGYSLTLEAAVVVALTERGTNGTDRLPNG